MLALSGASVTRASGRIGLVHCMRRIPNLSYGRSATRSGVSGDLEALTDRQLLTSSWVVLSATLVALGRVLGGEQEGHFPAAEAVDYPGAAGRSSAPSGLTWGSARTGVSVPARQ